MRRPLLALLLLLPALAYAQAADPLDQGVLALREGRTDEAIQFFTRVVDDNSAAAELRQAARVNRGTAYVYAKRFDEALADFDRALELDPQYAEAYYNRGRLRAAQGQNDEALSDLDTAHRLKPAFSAAAITLANMLGKQGNATRAVEVLTRSIAAQDDAWARVSRAGLFLRTNREDQALADYSRALELLPDLTVARMDRANLRMRKGDFAGAIADFTAAIDSGNAPPDAWFYRGAANLGAGTLFAAQADLDRFAAANPTDKYAAILRYLVSARAGTSSDAMLRPFLAAAPAEWPDAVVHFLGKRITRAELLAQIGDDPQRVVEGHYYLGQECLVRRDVACARKHFETSVATGLASYVEHQGATAELRRLPRNE